MSRRVPRLGLLARLGFGGVVGAAGLAAAFSINAHFRHGAAPAAPGAILASAGSGSAAAAAQPRAFDALDRLLGRKPGAEAEVTGSVGGAADNKVGLGPVSGLPMPRFVSLKSDRINVRQGPTRDQRVAFIFQRAGLPVEVTAEFENWRRIRDSEGAEGWVMQSFLSGRRTALIAPWAKDPALILYASADTGSATVAKLQPGVLATIKSCEGSWCRIKGDGFDGWIEQRRLWGAYPGEAVD